MRAKEIFPEGVGDVACGARAGTPAAARVRFLAESPRASIFLGQAFRLELQVQTKLQQIADLRVLASHVTSFTGNEPVSHTRDVTGMQNTIAKILEEEENLNARIDRLVDAKREIREVIDCVEDVTLRLILEKRHLLFQQWDEIAIDLGISSRWAKDRHRKALKAVESVLESYTPCHSELGEESFEGGKAV